MRIRFKIARRSALYAHAQCVTLNSSALCVYLVFFPLVIMLHTDLCFCMHFSVHFHCMSSVCASSNVNNVKFNISTIHILWMSQTQCNAYSNSFLSLSLFSLTLLLAFGVRCLRQRENAHFFMYGVIYNR